jgi:cobalt-zinc-cadmium efflux system membrane fusion protein
MKRILVFAAGAGTGIAMILATAYGAGWPLSFATAPQRVAVTSKEPAKHDGPEHIALSDDQIRDAGITVTQVSGGMLKRHFLAPGSLIPDADHIGRVSVRVLATVSELRKRIGDSVEKGEIVAAIESREVADAKSEYLAARLTHELQQTLFARIKTLVESRTVSENEFLRARLTANDAQIKVDSARQKLFALGLSEGEIADLPNQPPESLRKQFLRSPIAGRVSERRVDLGGLIGREGQESELFVIVNLDDIWVDLAVSPEDIASLREDAPITIRAIGIEGETRAQVIFVSPLLDRETRNARVSPICFADGAYLEVVRPSDRHHAEPRPPLEARHVRHRRDTAWRRRSEGLGLQAGAANQPWQTDGVCAQPRRLRSPAGPDRTRR